MVDKYIKAKDLKEGDMLHVTFMGGDGYIEVEGVEHMERDQDAYPAFVHWYGKDDLIGKSMSDVVPAEKIIMIEE